MIQIENHVQGLCKVCTGPVHPIEETKMDEIERLNVRLEFTTSLAKTQLATIERITRERDDAQANYQFMVKRVADEKLDGYRELGQRAADAEKRAETAERERDDARKLAVEYIEKSARARLGHWADSAKQIAEARGWSYLYS